jgi:hypothetical protein
LLVIRNSQFTQIDLFGFKQVSLLLRGFQIHFNALTFKIRYDDYMPGESKISDRAPSKSVIIHDLDFAPSRNLRFEFEKNRSLALEWVQRMSADPDILYPNFIKLMVNGAVHDPTSLRSPEKVNFSMKESNLSSSMVSESPKGMKTPDSCIGKKQRVQSVRTPPFSSNRKNRSKQASPETKTPIRASKTGPRVQTPSPSMEMSPSPLRRSSRMRTQGGRHTSNFSGSNSKMYTETPSESSSPLSDSPSSPVSEPDW